MFAKKLIFFITVLFALVFQAGIFAQSNNLQHSAPEAQGVSSAGILDFVNAAEKSKTEFHSFIFLRHGKVVAEGWWNPYRPDLKHSMYSCSKTFTATAVGFAIAEKKVSLDDKLVNIFPGDLPATVSTNLAELTVRDVLMMSDGQDPDPTTFIPPKDNWVKEFLATPVVNKPGTKFLYNSMGTYMLSAIVTKVTGQKVIDYLRPRLFDPLGIKDIDWEVSPQNINTGGWGLRIRTEGMAKLGQLYLQKGIWNGKQILPAGWAEEATTMKIMQDPNAPQSKKDSSDWLQGYCFQMWRCRHNAVRGDGAFGQYIIMMPDEDAVVAITAETPDMQDEINLVWKYLLPSMHAGVLPADNDMDKQLTKKLSSLALLPPAKSNVVPAVNISGKTFLLQSNGKKIQSLSFAVQNGVCKLGVQGDTALYNISFGNSKWYAGTTTMPGPYLVAFEKGFYKSMPPLKVTGSYDWKDDHTLELTLRYIESPHTEKIVCNFDGDNISADVYNSYEYGARKTTLTGHVR
ncbi:MAG TPA: serine hydrolase [Chitinophagaceae bacterium]|nr:serine hydrolase [Chitinophagaceae bacterium]